MYLDALIILQHFSAGEKVFTARALVNPWGSCARTTRGTRVPRAWPWAPEMKQVCQKVCQKVVDNDKDKCLNVRQMPHATDKKRAAGMDQRVNSGDFRDEPRVFAPLKPQRLSEEVYRQLKEAILGGYYKPGDRLPSEKAFCETFGVGRPVIREALRSLENSGLISVRPGAGGGAFVQKIDSSTLAGMFEGIIKMDKVSLEEITEARLALEMGSLPLVFEHINAEHLDELEQNLKEVRDNLERGVRGKRNLGFHVILLKASGNQLLSKIGEALMGLMSSLLEEYEYSTQRSQQILKVHEHLIHLLRTKRFEEASRILESHIHDTFHLFRKHRHNNGPGRRMGRKGANSPGGSR